MRTCVRVRRAPRPLGLLLLRRRLAARRAGHRRGRARLRGDGADRPQRRLGLDGVRAGGGAARPAGHPRRGGGSGGRPPPDAAGGERARLAQPLPPAHPRARAYARGGRREGRGPCGPPVGHRPPGVAGRHAHAAGRRAARAVPGGDRGARRGAGVPERLRSARGARRADAAAAAGGVRVRSPAGRAAAAVPARRPRAQPRAGRPGGAAGPADGGDRQRPRARARARAAAGRVHGAAPSHDAGRVGAHAARQLLARAGLAGGDGGALPRAPGGGGGDARAGRPPAVRPERRPRVPLPGVRRRAGAQQARRAVLGSPGEALPGRPPTRGRRARAARGGAAGDRLAGPGRLLPAAPRPAGAGARGGGGGARAVVGAGAAAAGARARVLGVLDRLLPHRPLAHRPGVERAVPRALPQRGADRAAGHRSRLPA